MTPGLGEPETGRTERDGRQQRPDEGHEDRAREAELHVREPEGQDDDVQAQALGQPDQPGQEGQDRQVLDAHGPEDALLEALVELGIRGGSGNRTMIRRPKLRIVNSPMAATTTTTMPTMKMIWIAWRHPAPEAPQAGREPQDRDREDVQDALDEDRPERPAERRDAVHLEQVGAVHVTELGRHDAVDEPRQVQDLDRVAQPDDEAGLAQEPLPAIATQRKTEVEHDEGQQDERRIGLQDEVRDGRQALAVERTGRRR